MTGRTRGAAAAELALWVAASLMALTAHVGGAVWLLRPPPVVPADDMPPAAIMIAFAETPEAVTTDETDISPDAETTEASMPAEQVDAPPEETPPQEAPALAEEVAEAKPEARQPDAPATASDQEAVEEELPVLDQVAVPLPVARPAPPAKEDIAKPTPQRKKPKPKRRQEARAPSQQRVQARVQTTQSNRNAARQTASGVFSSMTPATWQARLMAHLERRKTYPPGAKARGERGTVHVRFSIDASGNVLSVRLARSSGFPDLDREVLALVRRASPVPAPPPGANRTITAPVRFSAR